MPFRLRREPAADARELDIWLRPAAIEATDAALAVERFVPLTAPGSGGHRFYVRFAGGRWLKIDAKLDGRQRAVRLGRVARRLPAAARRLGPVVAFLGPDGAGKGTLIERLRSEIPIGVTVVYLGTPARRGSAAPRPSGSGRQARPARVREALFVARKHARLLRVLAGAYAAAWRGHVVLCDRHPLEVLAIRPQRAGIAGPLELWLARRLTPRPDAVVVLDAPLDVLLARKREQPPERLDLWRRRYREVFAASAAVVRTDTSIEAAASSASAVVWSSLLDRRRASAAAGGS